MREFRAAVQQRVNALKEMLAAAQKTTVCGRETYVQGQVCTIAEMHSLQHTNTVDPLAIFHFAHCKAVDAAISDASALDKPYPLEFWQASELCHTAVGKGTTACEIDIANAVASLGQRFHADVGDAGTMPEVDVMKVLAKLSNGKHSSVSDLSTLRQNKVSKSWTCLYYSLHALVADFTAVRQV